MNLLNLAKWTVIAGFFTALASNQMNADEHYANATEHYASDESDDCLCENEHAAQHVHFSSQDVDLYEETPDTLYQNADWPSKIEEFSDYLSR